MLYPTTCVGFGYGPTVSQTDRAGFLGSLLRRGCHSVHAPRVLSGLGIPRFLRGIYLRRSTRCSVCARTLRFSVTAGPRHRRVAEY